MAENRRCGTLANKDGREKGGLGMWALLQVNGLSEHWGFWALSVAWFLALCWLMFEALKLRSGLRSMKTAVNLQTIESISRNSMEPSKSSFAAIGSKGGD